MDADDISLPERFENQVRIMEMKDWTFAEELILELGARESV